MGNEREVGRFSVMCECEGTGVLYYVDDATGEEVPYPCDQCPAPRGLRGERKGTLLASRNMPDEFRVGNALHASRERTSREGSKKKASLVQARKKH